MALLRTSRGGTVLNTAFIERTSGTMRQRLAALTRKCRHAAHRLAALHIRNNSELTQAYCNMFLLSRDAFL